MTSTVKNFFLISSLSILLFSLKPLPLLLSLHALVKSSFPALLQDCFRYWKVLWDLPGAFFCPGQTTPTLSACFHLSDHPHVSSLDLLQQVHVLLILGSPELNAVIPVWCESGVVSTSLGCLYHWKPLLGQGLTLLFPSDCTQHYGIWGQVQLKKFSVWFVAHSTGDAQHREEGVCFQPSWSTGSVNSHTLAKQAQTEVYIFKNHHSL